MSVIPGINAFHADSAAPSVSAAELSASDSPSILNLHSVRPNAKGAFMVTRPFWLDRIVSCWRKAPIVRLSGVRRVGKTTLGGDLRQE
jgi:hypothetical protein